MEVQLVRQFFELYSFCIFFGGEVRKAKRNGVWWRFGARRPSPDLEHMLATLETDMLF